MEAIIAILALIYLVFGVWLFVNLVQIPPLVIKALKKYLAKVDKGT